MLFGCHCRDDRSFHYKGVRFPICARCTGELIGILFAAASYVFFHPGWQAALVLLIPMIVDGGVQKASAYESTNVRRAITGALFGYGIVCLFLLSSGWAFRFGLSLGECLTSMH